MVSRGDISEYNLNKLKFSVHCGQFMVHLDSRSLKTCGSTFSDKYYFNITNNASFSDEEGVKGVMHATYRINTSFACIVTTWTKQALAYIQLIVVQANAASFRFHDGK
jgi:hypothetical protein